MKKLIVFFTAILAVSFFSCNNEEENLSSVAVEQPYIAGTISGAENVGIQLRGGTDSKRMYSAYVKDALGSWVLFAPAGDPGTVFYKDWAKTNPYFGAPIYGGYITNKNVLNPQIVGALEPASWKYFPAQNLKIVSQTLDASGKTTHLGVKTFVPQPNFNYPLKSGEIKDYLSISNLKALKMSGYKFNITISQIEAKDVDVMGTAFVTDNTDATGFPASYVLNGDIHYFPTLTVFIDNEEEGIRIVSGGENFSLSTTKDSVVLFNQFRQRISRDFIVSWASFEKNPTGGWSALKDTTFTHLKSAPGYGLNLRFTTKNDGFVSGAITVSDKNSSIIDEEVKM